MCIIYRRFKELIIKALYGIVYTASTIIPISLFIQVIYRYVFKRPIPGIEELASASFVWLVIFGIAIIHSKGYHINIDMFIKNRNEKAKKIIDVLGNLIITIILMILVYSCYIALPNQAVYKTVVLKIPRTAHTIALITSFTIMIIQSIENIMIKIYGDRSNVN